MIVIRERRPFSSRAFLFLFPLYLSAVPGGCGGARPCGGGECPQDAIRGGGDASGREEALRKALTESAADYQFRGRPEAPITLVEFSDYECPFCGRAQETVEQILQNYPGKIRLVFRDFPLSYHRFAAKAAEAAHCAADQGRFWEMHEMLFENSYALREMDLKAYAEELGLDQGDFDRCLYSSAKAPVVEGSKTVAAKLGLTGAPSFFINGRLVTGAQPFEVFEAIIEDELHKADE